MKIIVLRTGDVVAGVAARRGEFERLIRETVGPVWAGGWETVDVRDTAAELPRPASAAAFIVTGSASSVTERAPWMLRAEAYLREVVRAEAPLLGICFGHQLIGQALGGEVTKNPRGREIGTVRLTQVNGEGVAEPMLRDLPSAFDVQATHVDSVSRLPPGARAGHDRARAERHLLGGARVRCVQFHPGSTTT